MDATTDQNGDAKMAPVRLPDPSLARALVICLVSAGVLAWGLYRLTATVPYWSAVSSLPTDQATLLRVDPNTARWWELTVIPGVGEVTAKKIVEHREAVRREKGLPDDAPVFRSAADLQRVKGIGPKKSAAAEPYLTFEPPAATAGRDRLPVPAGS